MTYAIFYWSRFGHNKKIVEDLSNKLEKKGVKTQIFKTDEIEPTKIPEAEIYIFSAPAEAFNVQRNMRTFMKKLEGVDGKKYAIINTHCMKNKNWLHKMEKILSKKKNMNKVAQIDFHISGEGQKTGDGLTQGWEKKLDEFINKI